VGVLSTRILVHIAQQSIGSEDLLATIPLTTTRM
jgi:hypothetical protein